MGLDHGLLNLPLASRGDFHKELDEHLQNEARRKKRAFDDATYLHEQARNDALRLFALIDNDLLTQHAVKRDMSPRALKTLLRELCNDKPVAALKALEIFVKAA